MWKSRNDIKDFYRERVQLFSNRNEALQQKIRHTSVGRIVIFLFTVAGIYFSAVTHQKLLIFIFLTLGIIAFLLLVIRHVRLYRKKNLNEKLLSINETEVMLMDGITQNRAEGSEFLTTEHPFAADLDVFGKRSLFQLLIAV